MGWYENVYRQKKSNKNVPRRSCGVTIALSRADLVASQTANDCVGITTQKDNVADTFKLKLNTL